MTASAPDFVEPLAVSRSPRMRTIFELLRIVRNSESTVLIVGESGTRQRACSTAALIRASTARSTALRDGSITTSWDSTTPVGLAVDRAGNACVAGRGYVTTASHTAVVITKLDPAIRSRRRSSRAACLSRVASTYLGGMADDRARTDHPGDGDGQLLVAAIRPQTFALRECYSTTLVRREWSGYASSRSHSWRICSRSRSGAIRQMCPCPSRIRIALAGTRSDMYRACATAGTR